MAVLDTLVAVIPLLGILIVVHELGHFLVAKACGVRVLKFSVGFGAPIGFGRMRLRWERNGTEYVIGWIPLGGFVRMLGEPVPGDEQSVLAVPDDARPDEYLEARPVWQKLAVVFAGPAMNLLLPIVCFVGVLWVGFPWPDAVIGTVEEGSPAARAGIEVGDRILSLEGSTVEWWDEVIVPIEDRVLPGALTLEIERDGERQQLEIEVESRKTRDRYGAVVDAGWIGIAHSRRASLIGVPLAQSPAFKAGLRSGDLVTTIDGEPVEDWESLLSRQMEAQDSMGGSRANEVVWQIERLAEPIGPPPGLAPAIDSADTSGSETSTDSSASSAAAPSRPAAMQSEPKPPEVFEIALPRRASLRELGVVPATILVGYVAPGRPAANAGLEAGDLVMSVDGEGVGSFESFVSIVQTSGGRPLRVTFSRSGEVRTLEVTAREETVAGPYDIEGMEEKKYQIGLVAQVAALAGERGVQQIRNPLESVPRALEMTGQMTVEYLEGLGKLFTGEVGTDKLSGPIGIARIARKSLDRGWLDYLWMMMLISINLGILNLLPIPILDGGQAVIYSIEGIMRSPLSMRAREFASSLGFAVLVLLMGRAFWNDLTPFWNRFVDWLSSGTP